MKRTALRWKPKPKSEDEKRTRALVSARSEGWCESRLPGCAGRATDKAHRVSRGVGGQWTPSNILDQCRPCHRWCTDNPTEANDLGLILKRHQDPLTSHVAYCNSGWVLLDDDGHLWPVGDEAA